MKATRVFQLTALALVVVAAVRQMLAITNATYGAASDFTNMARVVEEWAGVEIDGRPKAAE